MFRWGNQGNYVRLKNGRRRNVHEESFEINVLR